MGAKSGDQLKAAARERLTDAHVLCRNGRYLAALYMGGYAVEMMLKWALTDAVGEAKVAQVYAGRNWHDFTFMLNKATFKTALLSDTKAQTAWSIVSVWDWNWRYESALPTDFKKNPQAQVPAWLESVEYLIKWLNVRT